MTESDFTWALEDPADAEGRGLEETLVRRPLTALRCGGAFFAFTTEVAERGPSGCMTAIRFALHETGPHADESDAGRVEADAVVRPRIQAATLDGLGPLEMPALRQAARKLLRRAAAELAARG